MLMTSLPSIPPWLLGESSSSSSGPETSSAERFFPVVGRATAAASEVVAGVCIGRGGSSCCSGVWKVEDPGVEEGLSMTFLFFGGSDEFFVAIFVPD